MSIDELDWRNVSPEAGPGPARIDPPEFPRPAKDWSYAATLDIVRGILGPMSRVFYNKSAPPDKKDVAIALYKRGARFDLGGGDTFFDAVINTFVKPLKNVDAQRKELAKAKADLGTREVTTDSETTPDPAPSTE